MSTPGRRKPHVSTADLLTWSETPISDSPVPPSASRPHQPSDGIKKVVFGGQVTDEEVESLNKRKPCSGYKMKEMTGSGIFTGGADDETADPASANTPSNSKSGIRLYQQAVAGISHISFGEEEGVTTKKPTTIAEAAKLRELSGTLETEAEAEARLKKQLSESKYKELSGHDIFAPPPEILPREISAPRHLSLKGSIQIGEPTSPVYDSAKGSKSAGGPINVILGEDPVAKTAKKIYEKKISELSGNDIFKGDVPTSSAEKPPSVAKLREMSGSNIFADGKAEVRDYLAGRKPPGGESSIALV